MLFIHRLHRLTLIHFEGVDVFLKICENLRNLWAIKKVFSDFHVGDETGLYPKRAENGLSKGDVFYRKDTLSSIDSLTFPRPYSLIGRQISE